MNGQYTMGKSAYDDRVLQGPEVGSTYAGPKWQEPLRPGAKGESLFAELNDLHMEANRVASFAMDVATALVGPFPTQGPFPGSAQVSEGPIGCVPVARDNVRLIKESLRVTSEALQRIRDQLP